MTKDELKKINGWLDENILFFDDFAGFQKELFLSEFNVFLKKLEE